VGCDLRHCKFIRQQQPIISEVRRTNLQRTTEMLMDSLVGLSRGPERIECTGVLIVYDSWKHVVVTSYPCAPRPRVLHPEEDDSWLSS
jgi:hypothetical protein